jgi:hypothetical protein
MNLSHIINEFSFGPYFPDITQPLDFSYEIANERTSTIPPLPACLAPTMLSAYCTSSFYVVPVLPARGSHNLHRPALFSAPHKSVQRYALHARVKS